MFFKDNKNKKGKCKRWRWLRGVLFGGFIATLLTCLFTPKSGVQLRKKLLRVRTSGTKKGKTLIKNSKQHTKAFAQQTKTLAKNLTKEIQDFTKAIIDESKD
ncbi:ytxH-like family protein [Chlamydia ibidis]|uniref:YtxH-like family protein n=2 Tax=Chlamydia ibidis TaxID=1405396 RepID=S7J5P6_9CHLA|nr:YtxH domain-containing protein [Chlamydia ibidis]EPP35397.1 ytxH-like family protein [Chlamydia ibidis]EQM63053.1 ytxH-like family protein [Chlamydia ibidis 10-1398/6]